MGDDGSSRVALDRSEGVVKAQLFCARRSILVPEIYLRLLCAVEIELPGAASFVRPDPSAGSDWHKIVRLRDPTREIIARNSAEALL